MISAPSLFWRRLFLCLLHAHLGYAASAAPAFGEVYDLTDTTFDQYVNSTNSPPWLIDVYAPWCPACRELEPVLRRVALELAADGILVGKVDGTKQRGLLQRFDVRHFPSIYLVQGRETREYMGPRTLKDLVAFGRTTWRAVEPRTGCSSPTSTCGRAFGEFYKIPGRVKAAYFDLRDKKKYSDVSLFAGMLLTPVVFCLLCIALLDMFYSRRPLPGVMHLHHHD